MGKDKVESMSNQILPLCQMCSNKDFCPDEDLIKFGWQEDIWFACALNESIVYELISF